jgi:sugar/nucleoside kinase (ribokinase family)
MDTKKDIGEWATECSFIKINQKEYHNPSHYATLSSTMFNDTLIVTLGGNGCSYNGKHYETDEIAVRDVVGAGDTHLVGLVYGYLQNNDIEEGIIMANKLASDVVKQKGVALPNKDLL